MPTGDSDISWPMLRQVVRDWAGADAELCEYTTLAGGNVNTTLVLGLKDGRRAVLKITPHRADRRYADEAHQLGLIRTAGLPVPAVYALHPGSLDHPFSYLLLEFVDGVDLNAARNRCSPEQYDGLQRHLAELVLKLHATTAGHYMRASAAGDDPRFDAWHDCFRATFDPVWHELAKSNLLPAKVRKTIGRAHDRLDRLIPCEGPPRLLHGDLWATNLLARADDAGNWRVTALLDPNGKFGSHEAELAYMDLFHTATPVFFKAYQRERKLGAEYHAVRKPVYQLYNLMNHVRAFGTDYVKALCAQAEKVGALV
ncbi:MAG TPA: fructosamine kinase family protein [Humisphaera sp.]